MDIELKTAIIKNFPLHVKQLPVDGVSGVQGQIGAQYARAGLDSESKPCFLCSQ